MQNPKLKVLRFENSDVIATSEIKTFTLSNLGNGTANDLKLDSGGKTIYDQTTSGSDNWGLAYGIDAINKAWGTNISNKDTKIKLYISADAEKTFLGVFGHENEDTSTSLEWSQYNGTYYWDSANNRFVRQAP